QSTLTGRIRLGSVVTAETDRLRPQAQELGLSVTLTLGQDADVVGSESDLGLLIHNLLDNAIHYTPGGGNIEVALERSDGGEVVLQVRDTGMGIASRDLDRIFERFYRGDPARS